MTDAEIQELRDQLTQLQSRVMQLETALSDERSGPFPRFLFVRPDEDVPTWREMTPAENGGWEEYVDGRRCENDDEISALHGAPGGSGIPVVEMPSPEGYRYIALPGLVLVKVEVDGGGEGSASGASDYTYTVRPIDDAAGDGPVLGRLRTPLVGRKTGRIAVQGTRGIASWDRSDIVLWMTNEQYGRTQC